MRPSLELLLLMIFSIVVSILLASVARIISIEAGVFHQVIDTSDSNYSDGGKYGSSGYVKVIDDTPNELMWFVQVSCVNVVGNGNDALFLLRY